MTPSICPNCASDNVSSKSKNSLWTCESCTHEWTITQELSPLRIFLSYGRDEFAAVAERIRKDLVDRGYEVWFDIQKLKTGCDWEQYIEDGLKWAAKEPSTGRIVFVMTPHSVRRPDGYCLNEIALGLSKNLPIIPVMLVWSEPPLSIYRLQFLDMRETYRHGEKKIIEGVYEHKLERLAEALENKKINFDGRHSQMFKVLEPINFSADVFKLQKDFTGRQWVFAQVDRWLSDSEASKLFWIIGAPGAGKSAIAAYLRDNCSQVAAFHFCDAFSDEKRNPSKLVLSVACQLASQLPDYQERLWGLDLAGIKQEFSAPVSAYTLFDKLVVQPLSDNFPEPNRTLVVIIDALDEATVGGKNEIVRFLARSAEKTPKWLRFLLTSRPEQEVLVPLQAHNLFMLDMSSKDNREDLTAYLKLKVPSVTQAQLHVILEKSEGIFLYVKQVCEEISRGNLSLNRLETFPRGLGGIYEQFFERQLGVNPDYYQREIVPLLCLVLAAQESLTLGFLKTIRGWVNNNELFLRLDKLGSLFPRTGDSDNDTLRPFHKSVTEWLSKKASSGSWYIDTTYGHKLLADAGWTQFKTGPETMASYFLSWLPEHLKRSISEDDKLVELLKNFRFMMARLTDGALEQSLRDYRSLEPELLSDLNCEQAFFRERSHLLRRHSGEWPANKILLQLAVEHANNSPLTCSAEAWLEAGRCNWEWIRRIQRLDTFGIDPCVAVLEGHSNPVQGVLQRCDGSLVSWGGDATLRLWSNEGDPRKELAGHTSSVHGVLERRDRSLVSWAGDDTLRLWSSSGDSLSVLLGHGYVQGVLERLDGTMVSWSGSLLRLMSNLGDPLKALEGHTNAVQGVLERLDGTMLSWSQDGTLRLWSKEGDSLNVLIGHTGLVCGAFERHDGKLVSWSEDNTLRLWNSDGDPLKTLEGHTNSVQGALVRPDGTMLSWSQDGTLQLWSNDGNPLKALEGQTGSVNGAFGRRDGSMVSWSSDGTLRLWSRLGDALKVLEAHTTPVKGVVERLDGTLVSWSCDDTLRLWSSEGDLIREFKGHTGPVQGAVEQRDGTLVSWSWDHTLRLWSSKGDAPKVLEGHGSSVNGLVERCDGTLVSWSGDDRQFLSLLWILGLIEPTVSRSVDTTLRVWSSAGDSLKVLVGHTGSVHGVHERRDGTLVSWSEDETMRLWNSEGDPLKVLVGHTAPVHGVLALRDGTLVSWSPDSTLRLWSSEGDLLKVLVGHTGPVHGVLERRDGTLVSWSEDNTLRLWSSVGINHRVLNGHTDEVRAVLERRDGTLVSWSRDSTLRLWNSKGDALNVLKGHGGPVEGVLERRDGTMVSWCWAQDNTLRLWSSEGDALNVLDGHIGQVHGVLERPDGTLLSWSQDKTLRMWGSKGDPLKEISDGDGMHGYFIEEPAGPTRVRNYYLGASSRVCLTRFEGDDPVEKIIWQPTAKSVSRQLYSNGRMVITQSDGQVCFLQLYSGNQPISLEI